MRNYSLFHMIQAYQENKPLVDAYLSGKSSENYDPNPSKIYGMFVGAFVVAFLTMLMLWIYAFYMLITSWQFIPTWARVLCIISLFLPVFGGPVICLLIIALSKHKYT